MKNLILSLTLLMLANVGIFASNSPEPTPAYFTIESISFKMDVQVKSTYNIDVQYNEDENILSLSSGKMVNFLQILNADGSLEFQLPIFSNEIVLDLNDFRKGDYHVNLMVGEDEMVSSSFSK